MNKFKPIPMDPYHYSILPIIMNKFCENMFDLNDNIEWRWKQLELY
jgi:hypothetical protein